MTNINSIKKRFTIILMAVLFSFFPQNADAESYTEKFNSFTSLPEGWTVIGTNNYYKIDSYGDINHSGTNSSCIYVTSGSNYSDVLVAPKVIGKVTFFVRQKANNSASLRVYEYTKVNGEYVQGAEITSAYKTWQKGYGSSYTNWTEVTIDCGENGKRLGFLMNNACLDDFTAEGGIAADNDQDDSGEVAEVKTLKATAFDMTSDVNIMANEENMFTASFTVTVENTGNVTIPAEEVSVIITNTDGDIFATATAESDLAVGGSVTLPISVTMDAGDGGYFSFYAKENIGNTYANNSGGYSIAKTINVTAYIANFAISEKDSYLSMSSGDGIDFGYVQTAKAKGFKISNSGTAPLNITAITVPEGFSASETTFTVPAGGEKEFEITVTPEEGKYGSKSGDVTIAHTNGSFVFTVSGYTVDPALFFEGFETKAIPETWTTGESWTVTTLNGSDNYYAEQKNFNGTVTMLATPKLTIADGEQMTFQARRAYSTNTPTLIVAYSTDNENWTELKDYSASIESTIFDTYTISGIPAGDYFIAFNGNYVGIDNVLGYKICTNAPKLSVTDADDNVIKSGVSHDFGVVTADATLTIKVKNIGTADMKTTMEATEGFSVSTTEATIAPGEEQELIITMPAEPFGIHEGTVTVSTADDSWTMTLTGETRDPELLFVDFQDKQMPEGWYASSDWSLTFEDFGSDNYLAENINRDGKATPFITTPLKVERPEGDIVIMPTLNFRAKRYSEVETYDAILKVSYSADRINWTEAEDISALLTNEWTNFEITVPEGEYYFKFDGANVQIDDINGLKIGVPGEHIVQVTNAIVPAVATINNVYEAKVSLISLATESEEVTATLFIDGETIDTKTVTLNKTDNTDMTLSFTPHEEKEGLAVYVEITSAAGIEKVGEGTLDILAESDEYYAHTISGSITNSNGTPLEGVEITLTSTTEEAIYTGTTDSEGNFSIKVWRGNLNYTLTATKEGYYDATDNISFVVDINDFQISMEPDGSIDTGINTLDNMLPSEKDTPIYNISGQRVLNTYKGLVIRNGKKIIIK